MQRKWFLVLLLLITAIALVSVMGVRAAGGYSLDWYAIAGGGVTSSSGGNYSLGGTIGQPAAGMSAVGAYNLTGGFWAAGSDLVPPTVLISVRIDANPTNLASVGFTVTFSQPVTGVDTSDFALTVSGVTGASVSNVSDGPTAYTVAVNTGSGTGTLRLYVVDDDSIIDSSGNPLGGVGSGNGNFSIGQEYTVTRTYTISGTAGLIGVTITYTGGSTLTSDGGNYTISVDPNWTGTITPSLSGCSFQPPEIDITTPVTADLPGQDFTAQCNQTIFLPLVMR